jgi:type VI secretion system secreted protein VgrG
MTSLSDLLAVFSNGISQHARLITIQASEASGLSAALSVERFTGTEAVNALFCFDVDALSLSTDLPLESFLGEELTLRLLQADGSQRAWHGYCTDAAWLGTDGGVARYRLRLEPFLAFLRLRRDSYIFQDQTAQQIVAELLADYPQASLQWQASQTLQQRPICTQYRETDLDFFTRLLASEGLSWYFTHSQEDASNSKTDSSLRARHQLVVVDAAAEAPPLPGGYDSIRFHRMDATESLDAITAFRASQAVRPNAVVRASWHPQQLLAHAASASKPPAAEAVPTLEVFDGSGERQLQDADHASRQARWMQQALALDSVTFHGESAVRQLQPGFSFQLTQHDGYAEDGSSNAFKVLQVTHVAVNNLDIGIGSAGGLSGLLAGMSAGTETGTYSNHFSCVQTTVPIVPLAAARPMRATALGPQTAIVVGLPDTAVTTDRDHRVKVQFPWQRGIRPLPGGLFDTGNSTDTQGNAPGDDSSGTWVRVAEALAGPNWGSQFTPRIGTEVLVNFADGDMDRPVVLGQLYNGSDLPPFSAGLDSGINHAGVISGMHSQGLDGQGYNQWVVDDSTGQLRMRLASSTAASQLNLGYLVSQATTTGAGSAQRGSYRGSGFELRTDAWGVVRGGEGVLLSTHARPQQGTSVASTQMDATESLAQLKSAQQLTQALADAATHQTAGNSSQAIQAHSDFAAAIDPQQSGKHPASVNGQQAFKASAGSRELDTGAPVEKFATPLVLLETPASTHWASPASTAVFAGNQLQWTTQSDTHWAAGSTLSSVSGEATSLFSHAGGIQAYAGNGPLSLQAHTDALEILADQAVTVISVNGDIQILAKDKVTLQAGQSSVVLDGGNVTFTCPGTFTVKGAAHPFEGPGNDAAVVPKLPDTRVKLFDEQFVINGPDGLPLANIAHTIDGADGKDWAHSETDGKASRVGTQAADTLKLALRWHDLET